MSAKTLTLSTIQDLDGGKAALAVNHAIRQAVLDVEDRPGDAAARKVVLELSFKPELTNDTAALDVVTMAAKIKTSIPHRQTVAYPMLPTGEGLLTFEEHSPHDPRQATMGFVDKETGEVKAGKAATDDDETETQRI